MSFFFGKKDKKNLQVQPPGLAPSSPSPASPITPSSPSPPTAALSTSPLTHQPQNPTLLPYSPLSPYSPLTTLSPTTTPPIDSTPTLSIKKTKKKNALLSIFTKNKPPKQPTTAADNNTLSPTLSPASLSPNALSADDNNKKKKGGMFGLFKRKKKQKTLVKNDKGEEEEREISVSVTVSRLHRMDEEEDGLTSYEDDILIFPIFGIPLKKIMDIKQGVLTERGVDSGEVGSSGGIVNYLPKQMVDLCEYIRAVGLGTEGVFRISGESETIKDMKERIDRGEELELVPAGGGGGGEGLTEAAGNIHNLTGLFKLYWRSLGEPLFPFTHYEQLIAAVDAQQLPAIIPPLLTTLPEPNKSIVAYLLAFLSDVTTHFQQNKMTPLNLAVCFAPNLLRAKEEKAERVMVDAPKVVQLLCWMIEEEGRRREEERRREREEEESREQKREEERREREAEVMIATQRAKERRKQQEDHEREEKERDQQQREQQEAIEREIEEQMEQERQRKERQLAHLRDQDAKRKLKQQQQQEEEEERRRRAAAKKAQQTVLDHLPSSRGRSCTDGEEGEAPSFFAIPNPQSPVAGADGRKGDNSILPPFASSPLPVVILMPTSTFSSSAPSSASASAVPSPSSAVATLADRTRSSSNVSSRFAATTPTLPSLTSPAAGFVVHVVDEDERIVLSQGNQAAEVEDEPNNPPTSSSTTYYSPASPSSSPPSEPSDPTYSPVHIHVQPLPSDSPPSSSDADTDDDELSTMMRRLSVIELAGGAAGGSEEERRRSEVARLEESLKGKKAEEEERRREQQIVRLAEAMREKEERKKKNQQRKEEEDRDRHKEREALRASLRQQPTPSAGKDEEERKENSGSQLPELTAGEDYFQMLP